MYSNIIVTSSNNSLLPVRINDSTYLFHSHQPTGSSLGFKVGRLFGRTKNFFKRTETKAAAILSYWAVETVFFAIIMLAAVHFVTLAMAAFLYFYGTYALFSALNALTKA